METNEAREDGPLAMDLKPTIPANPRHGTVTIVATTGEYGRWRLSRVGLTLDDAIDEELNDYRAGLAGSVARGVAADAYADGEPDVALWEGERCLAVVRPRAGGDPEVTRFDGEDFRSTMPTTLDERELVGLARDYGVEGCRRAILETFMPNHGSPRYVAETRAEETLLHFMRQLGEKVAMNRLYLSGEYGVIAKAIERLGADAVGELRRQIEAGKVAS